MGITNAEKQELLAKAQRLEKKQLYVKAAEIYAKIGDEEKAAHTYETACDFRKAEALFIKLEKTDDAKRCHKKRIGAISDGSTWDDMHKKYQDEAGNPL